MIGLSGIIEDEMDDVDGEDTNTYDESGELVVNISRAQKVKPRQAILQLGHKTRARFVENNPNIFLEVKVESKVDEDNFRNCGYFGKILGLLDYAIDENPKEKLFNKKEIITMEEMRDILLESQRQAKVQADDIVYSINNNTYLREVSDEAIG